MKKIFTTAFLSLACLAAGAQSLIINFADGSKKTFDANTITDITFSPENNLPSTDLSGKYDCHLDVTIPAMPNMGAVVSENTSFSLVKGDKDNTYNISLPSCLYNNMELPAITASDVVFTESDGEFSFDSEFNGTDEAGKSFSGNLKGTISADGEFSITETMKYGNMPFDLQMQYAPVSNTINLAGEYDCHLDVTLPAMPDMGNVVSEDTKFSISAAGKEGCYNIILPSCIYNTMTLPAVTVDNVEFTEVDGSFSFTTDFSGTDDSGKVYSGKLSGSFSDKNSFSITETLKYGNMPFDLQMQYTPKSVTE